MPTTPDRDVSRRLALKTIATLGSAAALGTGAGLAARYLWNRRPPEIAPMADNSPLPTVTPEQIRSAVEAFTWEDVHNADQLHSFVDILAASYTQLTDTNRVTPAELRATTLAKNREEYIRAVRWVEPEYGPADFQWGYAHYQSRRTFIDLSTLQKDGLPAGVALLNAVWHEWGHLDVAERTTGSYIGNPEHFLITRDPSNPNQIIREPYLRYRGVQIYSQHTTSLTRCEEVVNETINERRMHEQLGLPEIFVPSAYYPNGVSFFMPFTQTIGLSVDDLYRLHATSDVEGLATYIGERIVSEEGNDPLWNGFILLNRIDLQQWEELGRVRVRE